MAFRQPLIEGILGSEMAAFNNYLDKIASPEVHMMDRSCSAFRFCGYTGLALAVPLALTLTLHLQLSPSVMTGIILLSMLTFLALVMATKIITGEERIIYYHHEIAVTLVVAIGLRVLRQPVLAYLEITIIGIGTFLACGRIGCLLVGCCHGRPCRWGVRYGVDHAAAGFPAYLVGVRLFPIQAVESLWVLCTVAVGTFFVWTGKPAGTAFLWYVIVYDLGRFFFEFARGDADRPYWLGFSQAQWISLTLKLGIVSAELTGLLPFVGWHLAALALLVTAMAAVAIKRRIQTTSEFELLHPKHMRQVATAMRMICAASDGFSTLPGEQSISIARTSLGIRISGGQLRDEEQYVYQYTLSSDRGVMTEQLARILAKLIQSLNGSAGRGALVKGRHGVFHLLISA